MNPTPTTVPNGIDTAALGEMAEQIAADQALGHVRLDASTAWQGGTRTSTRVTRLELNGEELPRRHVIATDEPLALLGADTAANPQELILAGLAGCMMVGFVAGCALAGIELESVEIRTETALDLRGFLGLDPDVPAGMQGIRYQIHVRSAASREALEEVHAQMIRTSPNFANLSQPIDVSGELVLAGEER